MSCAVLLYTLSLVHFNRDSGNSETCNIQINRGYRVADSISDRSLDYALNQNEMIPPIFSKVCEELQFPSFECDNQTPHPLIWIYNSTNLVKNMTSQPTSYNIYVRQGYSIDEILINYCCTCSEHELNNIKYHLEKELSPVINNTVDVREIFNNIYKFNIWGENREWGGYGSGVGSSAVGTQTIKEYLPNIIIQYSVQRVLDIGCGSAVWMIRLLPEIGRMLKDGVKNKTTTSFSSFSYYGVDASEIAIGRASAHWKEYIANSSSLTSNSSPSSFTSPSPLGEEHDNSAQHDVTATFVTKDATRDMLSWSMLEGHMNRDIHLRTLKLSDVSEEYQQRIQDRCTCNCSDDSKDMCLLQTQVEDGVTRERQLSSQGLDSAASPASLVIVRHVFFHLTNTQIHCVLNNLNKNLIDNIDDRYATYLLASNSLEVTENVAVGWKGEIPSGVENVPYGLGGYRYAV